MLQDLNIPNRVLLGPGPSDVHPRVLRAMATPLLGHLDPQFLEIMNDIMGLLRETFATENQLTLPMSGTGSAGMETLFVNLIEPKDKVVIGVQGLFGQRMVDMAERCGAEVITVSAAWGDIIRTEQIKEVLEKHPNVKLVALVHAETSTGVLQPLKEISEVVHKQNALLVVDAVTSLGGIEVGVDENEIDACFSGTQKCLSVPPGLAPVTLGPRATAALAKRKTKVPSWYLDLTMIQSYWGKERLYHHTAPISMNYALREGLRLILNEGLSATFERHWALGGALQAGLEAMGLTLHVRKQHRLPQLTAVRIPEGVDDAAVRKELLEQYGIEIGGGLGELKGKIWRIGLMGFSCSKRNVFLFLSALEQILLAHGVAIKKGKALQAAAAALSS